MSSGGFFGGFAGGYAQSSQNALAQRRLRDQLQLQQDNAARAAQLRERGLKIQEFNALENADYHDRDLDLRTKQMDALNAHNKFLEEMEVKKQNLELRKQDLETSKTMLDMLDPTQSPGVRKAKMKLFALSNNIDTKSETYKTMETMIGGMDEQELVGARESIVSMMPDAQPGEITFLSQMLLSKPEQALKIIQQRTGKDPSKTLQLKPVNDPTSTTGSRYATEEEALGKEVPAAPRNVNTPEELGQAATYKGIADQDLEIVKPIRQRAETALQVRTGLRAFQSALDSGEFVTGSLAGTRLSIARLAELTGLDDDPSIKKMLDAIGVGDPKSAEFMESIANQLGIVMAENLSTRVTNMSLEFVKGVVPGLLRTPEGNKIVADLFSRMSDQDIAVNNILEGYLDKKDLRPKGEKSFFQAKREYLEANPILDEDFVKKIKATSEKGKGINLEGTAEKVGEALGSTIQVGNGAALKVLGMDEETGHRQVEVGGKPYPLLWTEEDWNSAPEGTEYVWGPTGQVRRKGKATAPAKPQAPAKLKPPVTP